ncbi:hypothetical protein TUBRATIS_21620 [Tubulinosema ratisbonensis]|uniref:Uncharacterized protein n=1 Tax=Tubulinosema ratisbonensis TaxID=291195 RepID=A0A437AK34_9MICR|nr:hypothetical protein TUBRATIS_21620 [Tubulinosema ratisbonensis]
MDSDLKTKEKFQKNKLSEKSKNFLEIINLNTPHHLTKRVKDGHEWKIFGLKTDDKIPLISSRKPKDLHLFKQKTNIKNKIIKAIKRWDKQIFLFIPFFYIYINFYCSLFLELSSFFILVQLFNIFNFIFFLIRLLLSFKNKLDLFTANADFLVGGNIGYIFSIIAYSSWFIKFNHDFTMFFAMCIFIVIYMYFLKALIYNLKRSKCVYFILLIILFAVFFIRFPQITVNLGFAVSLLVFSFLHFIQYRIFKEDFILLDLVYIIFSYLELYYVTSAINFVNNSETKFFYNF